MNPDQLRKIVITAIFSDDFLLDTLVLKGGNALSLIWQIGKRTSVDLDFSIEEDFPDLKDAERRLIQSVASKLSTFGFYTFDGSLTPKPKTPHNSRWGGYVLEFKIIDTEYAQKLNYDVNQLRKQSLRFGNKKKPGRCKIDISKFEHTQGKTAVELDGCTCFVYTLPMIFAEKLRAICQQMEDYPHVQKPRSRSRDFYDIWAILDARRLQPDTEEILTLISEIFASKDVPLSLLGKIHTVYDFHVQDWSEVQNDIAEPTHEFRYYFDFVVAQTKKLETLWVK